MAAGPVRIGLLASSFEVYEQMEDFLVPSSVSHVRRLELARFVFRVGDAGAPDEYDLVLCELGIPGPPNSVVFYPSQPSHLVHEVLEEKYLKTHPNPGGVEYYLCGPPAMVQAATKLLDALKVPAEQIAFDEF